MPGPAPWLDIDPGLVAIVGTALALIGLGLLGRGLGAILMWVL